MEPLATEILLHQMFWQLTATFVSGMTTRNVCVVIYKCVADLLRIILKLHQ